MLKASNNHFIDWSKLKIPKIRPFYNLKSAKTSKKMWKNIISINFGRYSMHETLKKTPSERRDQTYLLHIYIFLFFENATEWVYFK